MLIGTTLTAHLYCQHKIESRIVQPTSPSIVVRQGNIIEIAIDNKVCAIVNAANKKLEYGTGIAGAIYKAESTNDKWENDRTLANETQRAASNAATASIKSGTVRATFTRTNEQGKLNREGKIKYIIHAVGPDARENNELAKWQELLEQAYHETFEQAEKLGCKSIAIPPLSSGVFGKDSQNKVVIDKKSSREHFDKALKSFTEKRKFQHLKTIIWIG